MGAFTEFTLAFTLIKETPPEVLGAFADCRDSQDAPALAALEDFFASRDELERAILATEDYFTPEEGQLAPLGAFASDGTLDQPSRVGMIRDEYADSPVIVWSVGRAPFQFE